MGYPAAACKYRIAGCMLGISYTLLIALLASGACLRKMWSLLHIVSVDGTAYAVFKESMPFGLSNNNVSVLMLVMCFVRGTRQSFVSGHL